MPDDTQTSTPLPPELRAQLEAFRRQLWRTKVAEAVFAGIFGLLFSFLLVFGLDRIWPTPAAVRLAILIAGTSLIAIFAPIWMHRWVWKHRRENQLARLIARKHPGLGDRLLGVIELQNQAGAADTLSPRLRAAAMEAVAAETARRKLDDSLPASRHRRWSLAVAGVFVVAAAALALVPQAGLNSLKRWLLPLSATERYTFTLLEDVPAEMPVPQGEAFTLDLGLSEHSAWSPDSGRARYQRQDPVTTQQTDGRYRFEFPGQQEPGIVRVKIGDARHDIRIVPSLRPVVERSTARIEYPDYLQRDPHQLDLPAGSVSVVRGSKVRLRIESSRKLGDATFGPVARIGPEASPSDDDETPPPVHGGEAKAMNVNGATAVTPPIEVGETSLRVPVGWTDHLGLSGNDGFALTIDALPDEAPSCYLEGMPAERAMLPEETMEFEVVARDDFGVREYGLVWEGRTTRSGRDDPASGELKLESGAPDLTSASIPAAFSPETLGIGPQKLVVRGYVEDYRPGRERAYSQPVTIYVLSREEHAQMLKNRFDRAIGELEDLARRERSLLEENQRLERLDGEELRGDEGAQRLDEQRRAETEQAERMKELADKMEELLKDSARNGSIDKETLRRMTESMQSMRELGEQDMPDVESRLGEAGDRRNTEERSEAEMEEAVERQEEVLEKINETIERAEDANERFEASTFASRLKKAAGDQDGIAAAAMKESEHFGLRPEQLDPAVLGDLGDIASEQSDTASDVRWLQEDLGHFFTRTDREIFGEILREMTESQIDIGLEDVRLDLTRNHSFTAAKSASKWADHLREWAGKLEGAGGDGGGGGGGGGGGAGEDEDFEFMLRVMRMVQQEQDLRARTRALETLRRSIEQEDKP